MPFQMMMFEINRWTHIDLYKIYNIYIYIHIYNIEGLFYIILQYIYIYTHCDFIKYLIPFSHFCTASQTAFREEAVVQIVEDGVVSATTRGFNPDYLRDACWFINIYKTLNMRVSLNRGTQ